MSDFPASGLRVVHVVNPNNPFNPNEDRHGLYQWTFHDKFSDLAFERLAKEGFSWICEDPQGRQWFRKPMYSPTDRLMIASASMFDNPMFPEHDRKLEYQWATFSGSPTTNAHTLLRLGAAGWDYTCTRANPNNNPNAPLIHVYRKRRGGVKRAREDDEAGAAP